MKSSACGLPAGRREGPTLSGLRRAHELSDNDFDLMDKRGRLPGEPGYQEPGPPGLSRGRCSYLEDVSDDALCMSGLQGWCCTWDQAAPRSGPLPCSACAP